MVDNLLLVTDKLIRSSFSLVFPTPDPEGPFPIPERRNPYQIILLIVIYVAFVEFVAYLEFVALITVLVLTGKFSQG